MSKERPILFSAPMVRAILEGRKTVTRRAVRAGFNPDDLDGTLSASECRKLYRELPQHFGASYFCPYGQPGERLWVRETFACGLCTDQPYAYRATHAPGDLEAGWHDPIKWKPSIHMPRAASRILLEITGVRVERLQDISRADIRAEGLECPPELASDDVSPNYRDWYPVAWRELWESTGGDLVSNPWVWVVEFKQVTP